MYFQQFMGLFNYTKAREYLFYYLKQLFDVMDQFRKRE